MGIKSLFGFGQARDKPVDKAADAGYSFLFGRTTSGKPVNERTAMQTTAVYACVRILAEAVASLPLHVYEYQDDGGKKLVHDHPLYYLLHDEPNPEMTSFVFRETLMSHLLIWGNAYLSTMGNSNESPSQNGPVQNISGPLIQIQEMSVRNDNDIRKISQELNSMMCAGRRARGLV